MTLYKQLTQVKSEEVVNLQLKVESLVTTRQCCEKRLVSVDYEILTAAQKAVCDDGDLLPGWLCWWATLAQELRGEAWYERTAIAVPSRSRWLSGRGKLDLIPVAVSDVVDLIGDADGRFLVWGDFAFGRAKSPLLVDGWIAPYCRGKAAAISASPEDLKSLERWTSGTWSIAHDRSRVLT